MVSGLFGSLPGDQVLTRIVLYQTVGQILAAALIPYERALEYDVNTRTPNAALTPPDLAVAVVRVFVDQADAAAEAAKAGVDNARFQTMVDIAGLAIAP